MESRPFTIVKGGAAADRDPAAEMRAEIDARNRQEIAIAELGQAALTGVDADILLGQACALVELTFRDVHCRVLECVSRSKMLLRARIGDETSFAACDSDQEEDDSVGMYVFVQESAVRFTTEDDDEMHFKCTHLRNAHGVKSGAGVTIRTLNGPYGVLLVYSRESRLLHDFELAFLNSVANVLGEAIARNRTEAALRKSENRLRHMISSALDAVVTCDVSGTVVEWNPQAEAIFGLSARDVVGRKLPSMILMDRDVKFIERTVRRAQKGRPAPRRRRIESVARRSSGEMFPVEVTIETVGTGAEQLFTAFVRDISERKRSQAELEERERRFRTIVEKSWSGVALIDSELRLSFAGSSTQNILGYEERSLIGRHVLDFIHPRERDAVRRQFEQLAAIPGFEAQGEVRFLHSNGTWVWLEGFAQNLLTEKSVNAIVLNYRDVTQRRLTEKQLEYRAHYDPLTGLPNRVLFRDRVQNALAQAQRERHCVAIMYIDLDHFKLVNDGLGHSVGDALLASTARRLEGALRASDTISRIGGDEFSVLIPDMPDANAAAAVARKLLEGLARPIPVDNHELYVTASIGIAVHPTDGSDFDSLVKCADAAMYRAKESGRNQARLFTPSMNERYVQRLVIEQKLHHALDRREFELFYQPIYDARSRRAQSVEALIRWNDPERGVIPPADFIPHAEETGMILPIGEWVLQRACMQLREWQDTDLEETRISVNVAAQHLQHPEFLRKLRETVTRSGIDPRMLQIEITETTAMMHSERTLHLLREVRDMGVSIAIDDFGTGQSSLVYLRQLPIDAIKIDKGFLRDVATDETAAAIASYTINLAHTLRLVVVAEGVETEEQYGFLKLYGCDQYQGYMLAPPLRVGAAETLLRRYLRPRTLEVRRPEE